MIIFSHLQRHSPNWCIHRSPPKFCSVSQGSGLLSDCRQANARRERDVYNNVAKFMNFRPLSAPPLAIGLTALLLED